MIIAKEYVDFNNPINFLKIVKITNERLNSGGSLCSRIYLYGHKLGILIKYHNKYDSKSVREGFYMSNYDILKIILDNINNNSLVSKHVIISGGEPFLQNIASLEDLFILLKKHGIKISIISSLHAPWIKIMKLIKFIDEIIIDSLMLGNEKLNIKLTGFYNTLVHGNLDNLRDYIQNFRFRMLIIPGYNDNIECIQKMAKYLKSFDFSSIVLLKFHKEYAKNSIFLRKEENLLNISDDLCHKSVIKSVDLFKKYGIDSKYYYNLI